MLTAPGRAGVLPMKGQVGRRKLANGQTATRTVPRFPPTLSTRMSASVAWASMGMRKSIPVASRPIVSSKVLYPPLSGAARLRAPFRIVPRALRGQNKPDGGMWHR